MKQRQYLNINTLKELSYQLGVPLNILEDLAGNIQANYKKEEGPDKKGKLRMFFKPKAKLKQVQRKINNKLLNKIFLPDSIQGGVKDKSIVTNAQLHNNKKFVGNLDIESFFPSINFNVIYKTLREQKCAPRVAALLTKLMSAETILPQGFATSPKMSGLILLNTDAKLTKLFKKYGLCHSFWIDDLTISGSYDPKKLLPQIVAIFKYSGFKIKTSKNVFSHRSQRQVSTNVVINIRPNTQKKWREQLRQQLYLCKKFGIAGYLKAHEEIDVPAEAFLNHLKGKVSFHTSFNKDSVYREQIKQIEKQEKIRNKVDQY